MDNRRVMKAYRDRSGQYQLSGGLFSRVKRYFSGSAAPDLQIQPLSSGKDPKRSATSHEHVPLHSNTLLADVSRSILSTSVLPATDSEDSNRILSTFFQEKGGKPLTDVEYEGVMSLLERSKASITLPLPDLTPRKNSIAASSLNVNKPNINNNQNSRDDNDNENKGIKTNNSINPVGGLNLNSNTSTNGHPNHTFGPYSQTKLRNSSMYLNNSSFAASDYKPQYHTFNESSSRANLPMKRVYQFSGLPSPYRTRIKAPNLAARKLRRITPMVGNSDGSVSNKAANTTINTTGANTSTNLGANTANTTSSKIVETESFRPKSKAANALLSVLDGNSESNGNQDIDIQLEVVEEEETRRPLHNPYFRPKRRQITRHPVTSLTAADISSTILHNKAEEMKPPMNSKSTSLFENIDESVKVPEEEKKKSTTLTTENLEVKDLEKPEKPTNTFSFGTKASSLSIKPTFGFSSGVSDDKDDVPKSTFTFKATEKGDNSGTKSPEKGSGFTFSAPKAAEKEVTEKKSETPIVFGFGVGSNTEAKAVETLQKSLFSGEKTANTAPSTTDSTAATTASTFSFGGQTLKPFSFGDSKKTEPSSFNFGKVPEKQLILFGESKQLEPVSFGAQNASPQSNTNGANATPKFSFGKQANGTGFSFGKNNAAVASIDQATTFGSTAPTAPAESTASKTSKASTASNTSSGTAFSFGSANGVSGDKVSGSNVGKSIAVPEFTFPEIKRLQAEVDENKVKSYESLYKF